MVFIYLNIYLFYDVDDVEGQISETHLTIYRFFVVLPFVNDYS